MSPTAKRIVSGLLVFLFPLLAVYAAKRTDWGALQSIPASRVKGSAKAPVLIVEFSDFQCPSCAAIQPTVKDLMTRYDGKIRLGFKHYPLRMHANAMPAARAAECASQQDKFWPYQDGLFENQRFWSPLSDPATHFMAIAQTAGLDLARFQGCYADPKHTEALIQADIAEAQRREVKATPTFFIGETRAVGGVLATDGARLIEKALRD